MYKLEFSPYMELLVDREKSKKFNRDLKADIQPTPAQKAAKKKMEEDFKYYKLFKLDQVFSFFLKVIKVTSGHSSQQTLHQKIERRNPSVSPGFLEVLYPHRICLLREPTCYSIPRHI